MRVSTVRALFLFASAIFVAPANASSPVEIYTGTATIIASLPGTTASGTTSFNYTFDFDTIDFAPGAVVFQGQPVDFDGHEAAWLSSTESGQFTLGTTSGPAVTSVTLGGAWSGSHMTSQLQGTGSNVQVGPSFSASNLDIVPSSNYQLHHLLDTVTAPPGLQPPNSVLTHDATHQIISIDAANGIGHVGIDGTYSLDAPVPARPATWSVIKVLFGGVFFFGGLLGTGVSFRRWKQG